MTTSPPVLRHIVLVGCCAEKLASCAPARELYRSQLFRKSAAWAARHGDDWRVLSAKHGVIKPDTCLMPYDHSMRDSSPEERAAWVERVLDDLFYDFREQARFTLLAGAAYATWVRSGMQVDQPMAGMSIGRRLQWLTNPTQESLL